MRVTVVCFGSMRERLPSGTSGNRAEVELQQDGTVRDLISELGAPEKEIFALLVDGRQAEIGEILEEGSEVTLMPPFTGGAT